MIVAPHDWVLLRGLTRESRHWGSFPGYLREAMGVSKVICFDLPGNGRLNRMDSPSSVEAMADWCHAELAGHGAAVPCGVVAMSLGAMVAVAWAQRHPADLAAAVLINTSMRPFSPFHRRLRPGSYPQLIRILALPGNPGRSEAEILRLTANRVPNPDQVVTEWQQWRAENPVSRGNALRQLLAAARYRAPSKPPLERMLLLAGGVDRLVDPRCSGDLARAWQRPLFVHPDGGHDLPLDDAGWVTQRIRWWIESSVQNEPGGGAGTCNGDATIT